MPASVNIVDLASGTGATLTTSGVTPSGANRAVWVGNICCSDTANYSDEAHLADSGGTPFQEIDEFTGTDVPLDIFSFVFAWGKTFGESGSPSTATRVYNHWPATQFINAASAIYVEDADQSEAFGSEQLGALEFLGSSVQTVTDSRTGLEPGQLVLGKLFVFTLGTDGPTAYAAAGDVDEIHGASPDVVVEGRHVQMVAFSGFADGSGDYDASITVTTPNAGELVVCRIVTRPVNEASGGPTSGTPNPATGVASTATLSGRSTAAATPTVAAGTATSNTLAGRALVQATPTAAAGTSITQTLAGRALAQATPTLAAGASTPASLAGQSTARGSAQLANGQAATSTLSGSSVARGNAQVAVGSSSASSISGSAAARGVPSIAEGIATTITLAGSSTGGSAAIVPAAGVATPATLAGQARADGVPQPAPGAATTAALQGQALASGTAVPVFGTSVTSTLVGWATARGTAHVAAGTATAATLSGSSIAVANPEVAAGRATTFTLTPITVLPPSVTALRVAATWNEWVKVTVSGTTRFRYMPQSKLLSTDLVLTMPSSIVLTQH